MKRSKLDRKEHIAAFLFILIPLIGFALFTVGSMFFSFMYSFTKLNPIKHYDPFFSIIGDIWVGFDKYKDLFTHELHSERFFRAIGNTLVLLLSVPLGMLAGLLVAALLNNRKIVGSKIMRMLFYLPAVSSAVAMNLLWRFVFNHEYGLINMLLHNTGLKWLDDYALIKTAIIFKNVWGGLGGTMIMYLAGMLNISRDYYEAADIDGANGLQKFFRITFPMLTPITFYLLIVGVIGGLQSYVDSDVFAQGNVGAQTIVYFIWKRGIGEWNYGLASAASVLLSVVIMAVTIVQFRFSNRWVFEE
ncbi:MAG: sugar ABC transporter permease [Clostridia bacterium]|nr:sugar ABC transporter permease [Clostridia bacterium]